MMHVKENISKSTEKAKANLLFDQKKIFIVN